MRVYVHKLIHLIERSYSHKFVGLMDSYILLATLDSTFVVTIPVDTKRNYI
jgi:hypothetical protein